MPVFQLHTNRVHWPPTPPTEVLLPEKQPFYHVPLQSFDIAIQLRNGETVRGSFDGNEVSESVAQYVQCEWRGRKTVKYLQWEEDQWKWYWQNRLSEWKFF